MMLTRKLALHLCGYVLIYPNGRLSPVTKQKNKISKTKNSKTACNELVEFSQLQLVRERFERR